MKIKLIKDLM